MLKSSVEKEIQSRGAVGKERFGPAADLPLPPPPPSSDTPPSRELTDCRIAGMRTGGSSVDHRGGTGGGVGPTVSPLLALPVDSLHCIASFLTPGEWSNLGQAGRGAANACREVFRRVRMHGFRCATEIVTAWVSTLFLMM